MVALALWRVMPMFTEKKTYYMEVPRHAGVLLVLTILIAWLSIQVVGVLPGVFSSLPLCERARRKPQGTSVEKKKQ